VQAAGSPPLTYQWRRDNVVIPGATGSVLRLENVTTPGTYAVDVTAQIGAPATASAAVGVITAQAGLSSAQPGYVPGGLVTLQASLSYSGTPTGLGYSLVLPPGWSLVSSTGEAEVKPVAGATDTLGWAWTSLPASPLSFSVTVQPPVGGTGSATLTGTGIVRTGTAGYELSLPVVTLPQLLIPVITTQPISQVAGVGAGVVFSVVATGSGPLSYVWTRNGQVLANGGQVAGAETATLTLASVSPAEAGSYQCRVANAAGEVLSTAATLTLASLTPEHALGATGYQPGASISVRSTLTHTNPAGSLTWSVLLPAGWNLRSSSGDAGALRPAVAATDLLEWTWATLPPSPFTFEYVLNTPAGSSGDRQVSALVTLRQAGTSTQVTAKPDPLQVVELVAHSADVDRNLRISLVELTRVIELYNTRSGPTRTGCYGNQAGTEDGFAAVPARGALERAVLGVYHSADANRDGKLNLLELTRVIELYNTREAGTRTGRYSLRPGTEDGFAPGG
jgi:hypothetical protein